MHDWKPDASGSPSRAAALDLFEPAEGVTAGPAGGLGVPGLGLTFKQSLGAKAWGFRVPRAKHYHKRRQRFWVLT